MKWFDLFDVSSHETGTLYIFQSNMYLACEVEGLYG